MKAIQLVETREGCAMMERKPRYNVLLKGTKIGQLYFNVTGYRGTLPTPEGHNLNIGEKGITAYRSEVTRLNREWGAK